MAPPHSIIFLGVAGCPHNEPSDPDSGGKRAKRRDVSILLLGGSSPISGFER